MSASLVAVAVGEDGTVSPHAGRALLWRVYAVEGDNPDRVWDLQLKNSGSLHEWHVRGDGNRHPLHSVDVAVAGSGGEGVIRRLAERQITLFATTEQDPLQAVFAYLQGKLVAAVPHGENQCHNP